ncbi:MAG: penicillin-binding protein activator LpoB [Pseudomonadota bacterium]
MFSTFQRSFAVIVAVAAVTLTGCAATTRAVDPTSDIQYDAQYSFSDKNAIVKDLTDSLLTRAAYSGGDAPILIVYDVVNETSEHISTSGITDDIRLALIQSGRYRFISREQRANLKAELAEQGAAAERAASARKLGAELILAGSLRSIEKKQPRQWRLNRKKLVYYSLNLELTDIQTGEIRWADKAELARESSRPIIGW